MSNPEVFLANQMVKRTERMVSQLCADLTGEATGTLEDDIERIRQWAAGRPTQAWSVDGDRHVLTRTERVVLADVTANDSGVGHELCWRAFGGKAVVAHGTVYGVDADLVRRMVETAVTAVRP